MVIFFHAILFFNIAWYTVDKKFTHHITFFTLMAIISSRYWHQGFWLRFYQIACCWFSNGYGLFAAPRHPIKETAQKGWNVVLPIWLQDIPTLRLSSSNGNSIYCTINMFLSLGKIFVQKYWMCVQKLWMYIQKCWTAVQYFWTEIFPNNNYFFL